VLDLEQLTRSQVKAAAYRTDIYFREGLRSWLAAGQSPLPCALVVLKPDAVAGRRLITAITALRDLGFVPAAVTEHLFTRHSSRALWQYQLNQATDDRLEVIDRLLPACPSLILLMRSNDQAGDIPAAVRLSSMKGPADPAERRPEHLRYRLRAGPTLFNFLHSADEPADVVRELAVLVPDTERRSMVEAVLAGADQTAGAISKAARLHELVPPHDLDFEAAVSRVLHAASVRAPDLRDVSLSLLSKRPVDWRSLEQSLHDRGVHCDLWDLVTIAVYQVQHSMPGIPPLVPTVGMSAWAGMSTSGERR
jgi:hypothetical protein